MADLVVVTPEVARILVTHLPLRRLRVTHRANEGIYRTLLALAECALDRADANGIAIAAPAGNDSLVTVNELARATGEKPDSIRAAIRAGRIQGAVKRDGRWYIPESAARRLRRRCYCPGRTYCDC